MLLFEGVDDDDDDDDDVYVLLGQAQSGQ